MAISDSPLDPLTPLEDLDHVANISKAEEAECTTQLASSVPDLDAEHSCLPPRNSETSTQKTMPRAATTGQEAQGDTSPEVPQPKSNEATLVPPTDAEHESLPEKHTNSKPSTENTGTTTDKTTLEGQTSDKGASEGDTSALQDDTEADLQGATPSNPREVTEHVPAQSTDKQLAPEDSTSGDVSKEPTDSEVEKNPEQDAEQDAEQKTKEEAERVAVLASQLIRIDQELLVAKKYLREQIKAAEKEVSQAGRYIHFIRYHRQLIQLTSTYNEIAETNEQYLDRTRIQFEDIGVQSNTYHYAQVFQLLVCLGRSKEGRNLIFRKIVKHYHEDYAERCAEIHESVLEYGTPEDGSGGIDVRKVILALQNHYWDTGVSAILLYWACRELRTNFPQVPQLSPEDQTYLQGVRSILGELVLLAVYSPELGVQSFCDFSNYEDPNVGQRGKLTIWHAALRTIVDPSAHQEDRIHAERLLTEYTPPDNITIRYNPKNFSFKQAFAEIARVGSSLYTQEIYRKVRMATHNQVNLPLPILPQGWSAEKDFKAIGSISAATLRSIEPVGPHFLAHARRARHKRTFSEDDRIQAQESVKKVEDDDAGEISEPEDPSMLLRDAKDWKSQDHYAVLGLSKYRYKATEEQIKRAHRKKVLRHHPDKKAAAGSTEDDSFFKCIQKATEILLDPVKRRQFDSVDERADVEPPTKKQAKDGKYYKLWSSVFKAEGRFSRVQPVPKFGDEKSTQEEVEHFYNFFYNFDSWRSFEYQDEDVPDDNENRDQKRHMERKNNNARKKKKNEDVARLRALVDRAMEGDERIKQFRKAASENKNKKKNEREAAEKKAKEEAAAKKAAEEQAAKDAEAKAKAEKEQGKKAKEAAKAAVKKNRRVMKGSVKDANYFVKGEAPASAIDAVLNDVELIQGKIDADETAALAGKLNGLKLQDEIKTVWAEEVKRLVGAGKIKEGDAKNLA